MALEPLLLCGNEKPLAELSTSAIKMPRPRLKANFLRVVQIPQSLRSGWENRKGNCWSDLHVILVILDQDWIISSVVLIYACCQLEERLKGLDRLTRRFARALSPQ